MKEMDGWRFIGYYGVFYLFFLLMILAINLLGGAYLKPILSLIFPIAANSSPLKIAVVMTLMYWGMVCFYVLVIQKQRLKF